MRILITGGNGQLGRTLVGDFATRHECLITTREGSSVNGVAAISMDMTLPLRIQEVLQEFRPEVVINCAACTAVDGAEQETELAYRVNTVAVGVIAEEAANLGALLVHFSTDYVFSGASDRPWRETDPTVPINVYGHTKLGGEEVIRQQGLPHLILRTSWVYAAHGQNFVSTMLRLGAQRDGLTVVNDQVGAPSWTVSLSHALSGILNKLEDAEKTPAQMLSGRAGTYHLSNAGQTTWYDYAGELFQLAERRGLIEKRPELTPTSTEAFGAPARRPAYSVLDNSRIQETFGTIMPHWQEDLARCVKEIADKC